MQRSRFHLANVRLTLQLLIQNPPDLTIVEEVDTEIALGEVPGTPQRFDIPLEPAPFRSPGAVSEMSGTTAISSFSMIEAEFLDPKYMLKHVRKLCDSAEDFLQHLAPKNGSEADDRRSISEIQKPDSDFTEEYRDFDEELTVHLKHFKSAEHNYIHIRAVHRALFGSYNDVGALRSGIDLVFYLANILILGKQMIHHDRSDKDIWNHLRQLDSTFPSQFMRSLVSDGSQTAAGDSVLLEETFKLGLELRTQLAVSLFERFAYDAEFNPDEALEEIFIRSEASQDIGLVRGWSLVALGGDQASLSHDFQNVVLQRINDIRSFILTDSQSLENGDLIDQDGLASKFPWEPVILQLLQWVRLRHGELSASIEEIGGSAAILANVKQAIAAPQPAPEDNRPTNAPRDSPRKKRTSFGRYRRRSSRKFDPNAPIDVRAIDALKARERDSGVHFDPKDPQPGEEFEQIALEEDSAQQIVEEQVEVEDAPEDVEEEAELSEPIQQIDDNIGEQTLSGDEQQQGDATLVAGEEELEDIDQFAATGPPKSTQDVLAALHSVEPTGKENRKKSYFERQADAQRVEFEDGFGSSQATPGPSTRVLDKGKQRADLLPSVSQKRAREESDEEEEDEYEATERTSRVQERRQKKPVSKRVRVEPPSSAPAPPSHQPVRASQTTRAPSVPAEEEPRMPQSRQRAPASSAPTAPRMQEEEESLSEREAPEMTEPEPEPPRSTYNDQRTIALQNSAIGRPRQPRRTWTMDMEEALVEYMARFPRMYSQIQKYDASEDGYGLLEDFTQVNLKDKTRTMAINMIK